MLRFEQLSRGLGVLSIIQYAACQKDFQKGAPNFGKPLYGVSPNL